MSVCSPRYSASLVVVAELYHYVVVRSDLPRGLQAANVVHAAGESSPGNLPEGTHAICLTVPSEMALREVSSRLTAAGLAHVPIIETDAPYAGALMAVGCVPAQKEVLRRVLSALPLLR